MLTIYQNRLPHWRMPGGWYFVTWRLHQGQHALSPDERSLVRSTLLHFQDVRYQLAAFVVMDDHVHVLVQLKEGFALEKIVQSWKSYTAHQFVATALRAKPIWQREYFDRIMRDEAEFTEKYRYILANPVRRWPDAQEYRWVWSDE